MGYIKHESLLITVSAHARELAEECHSLAEELLPDVVTELKESPYESYYSFAVLPDGSKEGWDESDKYEQARDELIQWIVSKRYEDDSSPIRAVLATYDEQGMIGIMKAS